MQPIVVKERQRILFGTNNPAKVEIIKAFVESLPVEVLSPVELGLRVSVREDGQSAEENAVKKARTFFAAARMPTFALDTALTIESLPAEEQPGLYVRRLGKNEREVSDREVLEYYSHQLGQIGGTSLSTWTIAMAFTSAEAAIFVRSYAFQARMVSKASPTILPGAPLSSLLVDERTGKYFSETDHRDRVDAEWVKSFIQENLARLDGAR